MSKFNVGLAHGVWEREKNIHFKYVTNVSFAHHLLRTHQAYCTICRPRPDTCDLDDFDLSGEPNSLEYSIKNVTKGKKRTDFACIDDPFRLKAQVLLEKIEKNQTEHCQKLVSCLDIFSGSEVIDRKEVITDAGEIDLEAEELLDEKMKQLKELHNINSDKPLYTKIDPNHFVDEISVQLCEQEAPSHNDLDMECDAESQELSTLRKELPELRLFHVGEKKTLVKRKKRALKKKGQFQMPVALKDLQQTSSHNQEIKMCDLEKAKTCLEKCSTDSNTFITKELPVTISKQTDNNNKSNSSEVDIKIEPYAFSEQASPSSLNVSPILSNTMQSLPNTSTSVPNTNTFVLNTSTFVPNTSTFIPNTSTLVPNTNTFVNNTSSFVANTSTFVPNTVHNVGDPTPACIVVQPLIQISSEPNLTEAFQITSESVPNTVVKLPNTCTSLQGNLDDNFSKNVENTVVIQQQSMNVVPPSQEQFIFLIPTSMVGYRPP